jgi:hypothetical protein
MAKTNNEEKEEKKSESAGAAEKMIQIPESQLKDILGRLDILTKAVPASGLAYAMGSTEQAPIVRRLNLNVYRDLENGKEYVITKWQMVIDEVFVSTLGVRHEKQVIRLFLDEYKGADGNDYVEVNYADFVRRTRKQPADILETITRDNATLFKVKTVPGGKMYEIDKTFVN